MDDEALRRGTTTYLVQRRLDMLPKPLTEDICSLRADEERLAFSVFWRVDTVTMLPEKRRQTALYEINHKIEQSVDLSESAGNNRRRRER